MKEKTIERKVIMFINPEKRTQYQFIGSLIDILQNEIPKLTLLKKLFEDLHSELYKIGFPVRLEFNVKKNVWIAMNIRGIQTIPLELFTSSVFQIPL